MQMQGGWCVGAAMPGPMVKVRATDKSVRSPHGIAELQLQPNVHLQENRRLEMTVGHDKDQLDEALEQYLFGAAVEQQPAEEASVDRDENEAVWVDEDDAETSVRLTKSSRLKKLREAEAEDWVEGEEYTKRLRNQFVKTFGEPKWAKMEANESESEDEDEQWLRTDSNGLREGHDVTGHALLPGKLSVSRVKDANISEYSKSVVNSVQFHRDGQILFTAGLDKTLRLFHIDGLRNSKIQSVHLEDLPVHSASFSADGNEIWLSGRRKHFYVYDINAAQVNRVPYIRGRQEKSLESFAMSSDNQTVAFLGCDGNVSLVSRHSKQRIGGIKMNGSVRSVCFRRNGLEMLSFGTEGQIYAWDLRTRRCFFSHHDDGCVHGTAIGAGIDSEFYATGSDSGVVNLYSAYDWSSTHQNVAPRKALMSLTTPVDQVQFNHDSQLMAISSRRIKDALRLVHLPSGTVFSNWPTHGTPLHFVSSLDFSPRSGYLAIGNDRGKVLLYRLTHYSSS